MTYDEYYGKKFEETIKEDPVISEYEHELEERSSYISNMMVSTNVFEKLIHPVKLVRTIVEGKRTEKIKAAYDSLKSTPLIEHFDEEEGDLNYDFNSAATCFKPRRMREFIKYYPLKPIDRNKLLTKKL